MGTTITARGTRLQRAVYASSRWRFNPAPWAFLALPLALYLTWVIGPMLYSFYLSATDWDGISLNPRFIGLNNYRQLLNDPVFAVALLNNLKWLLVFTVVPIVAGLGLALLLNTEVPGIRWFKAAFYSPMVLSFVVIGLIWSWLYHPSDGLINSTLIRLGLVTSQTRPSWLADPNLTLFSIVAAACWRQTAYVMLLYLAGLKTIDPALLEAAQMDGASRWQQFRHVVIPLLLPATIIVVVITVIDSLRAFDLVYVMTKGGPGYASTVLALFMYIEALNNYRFGYGAAIAVVQFLISFIFIAIYLSRVLREEVEH
jgi:ABC-type sugar transport system permease subunit